MALGAARTVDSAVRLDGVQQKGHDQPRALVVHASTMLRALAGKEDWKRVHGRMACKAAGSQVPPPTAWHEPECGSYYPHLSTHPFHEPGDAWYSERVAAAVALLERFYPTIKDEMLALPRKVPLQQYRQPNTAVKERQAAADGAGALLHEHGDWKVHYLQLEGASDEQVARMRLAPKTFKIVRSLQRNSGHSLFSVMEPGTHILPHCGPGNYRLRLHLGLVVPEGCRIRVGDQVRTWTEGKVLVLDDAFQHEVWNDSAEQRVVLIVDIWHPDFSDKEVGYMEQTREAGRRRGKEVGATRVGQEPPAVRSATAAAAAAAMSNPPPHEDRSKRPHSAALLVSAAAVLGFAVLVVAKAGKARRV